MLVKEMCPKIETLEYRIDCVRYDEKTYNALNVFLEKGYVAKSKMENTLLQPKEYLIHLPKQER